MSDGGRARGQGSQYMDTVHRGRGRSWGRGMGWGRCMGRSAHYVDVDKDVDVDKGKDIDRKNYKHKDKEPGCTCSPPP